MTIVKAAAVQISPVLCSRDGGTLIQRRRKISPTFHERMIWGQGDGSGLRAVNSAVGRIGQLACWGPISIGAGIDARPAELTPTAPSACARAGF
jgi:predicted amidohydrolase